MGLSPRDFDIPIFGTDNRTVFTDSGLLLTREALEAAMTFVTCPVNRIGEGLPITHESVVQYSSLSSFIQQQSDEISIESKKNAYNLNTTPTCIDIEKVEKIKSIVNDSLAAFARFKSESMNLLLSEKDWSLSVSQYFREHCLWPI